MHFMIEQNLLFRLRQFLKPYLQPILSTATFCKPEAQKVLDDDSSKILLFFTSSAFSLSRHYMTLSRTYTTTELQLLKKGVVKSWLGPLTKDLYSLNTILRLGNCVYPNYHIVKMLYKIYITCLFYCN